MMSEWVTAIGASNIDIHGFSNEPVIMEDSNPGKIHTCPGGVSRNISENLIRLGVHTKLMTALGDDMNGLQIRESCKNLNIDLSMSLEVPGHHSSTYMAVMDPDGEMILALSDMRILDKLTVSHLKKHHDALVNSSAIVMDAGLPPETMHYITSVYSSKKTFLDPVSVKKCYRMEKFTGQFYCLKLNRLEASYLSGITINNDKTLQESAESLLNLGVKRVYISLGADGIFYAEAGNSGLISAPTVKIANATGAGDAVTAAVIWGELQEWSMKDISRFAIGAATITISCNKTVSEDMNIKKIEELLKEKIG
ncbi:pseudouridine kinase [Tindallia magadiensis]|uniref:Pseudouridine kinase n=1 Tax=Tindallia magadiensis TaxID=69895 RepID=A0A1I3B2C5_9FIRM|nr:carbohydrate kinase family protein [Tindallia magadiensis]SFH56475.1 pseudouridine kinase [Tindallia magadiensis]